MTQAAADPVLGERLRAEREEQGISLRALARKLGVSPSLLSQIETGKSGPSVATLYGIVNELGLSLDRLFFEPGEDGGGRRRTRTDGHVLRLGDRHRIELESGVHWERLSRADTDGVDFLHITYDPGGESTRSEALLRHAGREFGVVLSGRLGVTIAFEQYELGPGDSISFDSSTPHRLHALGDEQAHAIWVVLDRS